MSHHLAESVTHLTAASTLTIATISPSRQTPTCSLPIQIFDTVQAELLTLVLSDEDRRSVCENRVLEATVGPKRGEASTSKRRGWRGVLKPATVFSSTCAMPRHVTA
jgi:hypothetical protein